MKQAAYYLPPLTIIIAIVLHSASGGFSVFAFLTSPIFLALAAIICAVIFSRKIPYSDSLRFGVVTLYWISFGILIGFAWLGARSEGYVSHSSITSLLGLNDVFASTWLHALIALCFSFLFGAYLSKSHKKVEYLALAFFLLGFGAVLFDLTFGWRAPINITPDQTVSYVSLEDEGKLEKLPFSLKLKSFTSTFTDDAYRLKISDQTGKTLSVKDLVSGEQIKLPGTDSILELQPDSINATINREGISKSTEFKSPKVQVLEVDKATGKVKTNAILYGYEGAVNSTFLKKCGYSVFFRFYGEQEDYNELFHSNLPYVPVVEVRFVEGRRAYSIPVIKGKKINIPDTHYSVSVSDSRLGDSVSGDKGWVNLSLQGPKGKEEFSLTENVMQLKGKLYTNVRLIYRHPEIFGESRKFIRILSADGCAPNIAVFDEGIKIKSLELGNGNKLSFGDSDVIISGVLPEGEIIEKLVEDEFGIPCPVFNLIRGKENKRIVISPYQFFPVDLHREKLRLALKPISGSVEQEARMVIDEKGILENFTISSKNSKSFGNFSISLLGVDPLQQSYITIGITKRFFRYWALFLMYIGILVFILPKTSEMDKLVWRRKALKHKKLSKEETN